MSIELMIYLANILPNLGALFRVLSLIGLVVLFVVTMYCALEGEKLKVKWYHIGIVAMLALVGTIIPSERTIYMMAGASIGKDLIASETGVKVQKLLNSKLDELISQGEKK